MKNIISYCLFILFVFSMQSCKEDPGGTFYAEPEPVFSVAADFGLSEILFEAGKEDFYMFTSYDVDSLGVLVLKGEFNKLENCLLNCEESLSISLRDSKVFDGVSPEIIDISSLKNISYGFVGTTADTNSQTVYEVTFVDQSYSNASDFSEVIWSYPNSSTDLNEFAFMDSFESSEMANGIPVSLTSVFSNGCTSSYTAVINTDYPTDCYHDLDFNIVPSPDGVNYQILPFNSDNPDWIFNWDDSFADTMSVSSTGTYCFEVTNAYGCSAERCITISQLSQEINSIEYCYSAFSYQVTPLDPSTTSGTAEYDFSKIQISYTSKDGTEYRSDRFSQPQSSFFIVESAGSYELNEFQQPTLKLDASFRVVLYNDLGEGVLMDNGEATFGVAIPE